MSAPAVWNGAAAVAGGAALGALCRWGAGLWLNARWQGFPLGTLFVNLLGGLLIGVASGVTTVFFPSATEAVMYVMMGLVLLVRPRGLLGEEGRTQ